MPGRFSEDFKQQLYNKIDVVDIISKYVDLKKKGGRYWGCCPFHTEKTASFNVDVNKQFFYCFGCHKGGDVIKFVMEMEHMTYPEAVEYLCDKAGISVPQMENSKQDIEKDRQRKKHYEISKAAAGFYYNTLISTENKAVEYCKKRKISSQIVTRFGIGYAPEGGRALVQFLKSKGFTFEEMLRSGLAKKSSKGSYFDFFIDRLMFPIMDVYGNVIAFGGRVLDDGQPKYLNSLDSPLYNKRRHLYGLNIAKKNRQTDRIILVEGYMDVVSVSSYGVVGAVASLGTALTTEQCSLIKRFTKDVVIAYDGDKAGQTAAIRAGKLFMEEGIIPKIVVFKDGLDPDDFMKKYGADEFEKLVDNAVLPYKFELDVVANKYDMSSDKGRRDFAAEAVRIISIIKNELDREDITKYVSVKTGYSAEALNKQTTKLHKMEKNSYNNIQMTKTPESDDKRTKAEALALKLALNGYGQDILLNLDEKDFANPVFKECYSAVKDGVNTEQQMLELFSERAEQGVVMKIMIIDDEVLSKETVQDCVAAIRHDSADKEMDRLKGMLANTDIPKDERIEILKKISQLQKQLKQN